MRELAFAVLVGFVAAVGCFAQNPLVVAPDAYRLQFENEVVRVLRVRYEGLQKVPVHDHSRFPAAYVYLNDAGPVNFIHVGWEGDPILTRRPVKAGTLRLSKTSSSTETHSVHNVSKTATDFLRIEFKTLKQGDSLAYKRYEPDGYNRRRSFTDVHLASPEIVATRVGEPAGGKTTVSAAEHPALLAMVTAGQVDGRSHAAGDTLWIDKGRSVVISAPQSGPLEFFRFDIAIRGR
jgi:hypothetical protein